MRLHPAGYKTILILTALVAVILVAIKLIWPQEFWLILSLYLLGIIFLLLVIRFFRRPNRAIKSNPGEIYSAADGTVVAIEEVFENEYFKENRIQVSVFMSVFNVHINWLPLSGKIMYRKHQNGKHYPAYLPKSSKENEHNTLVIRSDDGKEIMTKQIAGILARRIICNLKVGDTVSQGNEIGIIKFGSRVDLFLPVNADIKVSLGDKTRGNKTLIATL